MDIVKELQELIDEPAIGHDYVPIIERAIAEIRRMRSIAGPVDSGPSAADVMEPLRHRIQDGIEAEKALAAAYEADVKAFAAYEANWNANAFVIDSAALRETYEFKPLPRASSTTSPPQSGSVRAKLWD